MRPSLRWTTGATMGAYLAARSAVLGVLVVVDEAWLPLPEQPARTLSDRAAAASRRKERMGPPTWTPDIGVVGAARFCRSPAGPGRPTAGGCRAGGRRPG